MIMIYWDTSFGSWDPILAQDQGLMIYWDLQLIQEFNVDESIMINIGSLYEHNTKHWVV